MIAVWAPKKQEDTHETTLLSLVQNTMNEIRHVFELTN